jgi:hypothetical protein
VSEAVPRREAVKTAFERDERAERELLEELVSYSKKTTGVVHTVFISPKGFTRHAPRIKVAIDPKDSCDPRCETATIAIHDGDVVDGKVPTKLLKQVREFIELNRQVLLDYWDYRINTEQLQERLKSIGKGP